jgi:CRISPR-associated protein Csy1
MMKHILDYIPLNGESMKQEALSAKIAYYIQSRLTDKLEKLKKAIDKKRESLIDPIQKSAFEDEYQTQINSLKETYSPANWLTNAAARASQIQLVTHALKFTHTDAKGTSVYCDNKKTSPDDTLESSYLSTADLPFPPLDVVGNAAALDVAKLLQLTCNGKSLIELLTEGDHSALIPFAISNEQLQSWVNGFLQVLQDKQPSSHSLAKQLYFPINDEDYHLISPLFASSLAQTLHQKLSDNRYGDVETAIRKLQRNKKYSSQVATRYPNTAIQKFGGTKPQNVSQLNTNRGGKSFLLNSAPPVWISQMTHPAKDIFAFAYNKRAKDIIKQMRSFLLAVQEKESTLSIHQRRAAYVDDLIDILFAYVTEIHHLKVTPGWSKQTNLPQAQSLWLDPHYQDELFQQEYASGDWKQQIADQFATWLNKQLHHKKLVMGDEEHKKWRKSLIEKLEEWS